MFSKPISVLLLMYLEGSKQHREVEGTEVAGRPTAEDKQEEDKQRAEWEHTEADDMQLDLEGMQSKVQPDKLWVAAEHKVMPQQEAV